MGGLAQALEVLFGPVERHALREDSLQLSFTAQGRPFLLHLERLQVGGWPYALASPVSLPLQDLPLAKEAVNLLGDVELQWTGEGDACVILARRPLFGHDPDLLAV